jgi:exonuclease III
MSGEFNKQKGAKFATINEQIQIHTDFVILSETKINHTAAGKRKLKYGLTPTLYTSQQGARGGVVVFSHPDHALLEGSARESDTPGHFVCGTYQIGKSRVIVAGVYGRSDNLDRTASAIFSNLAEIIEELKFLYNTNNVIMAGDFNVIRSNADSHNNINHKPRTTEQLEIMIEQHNLTDIARASGTAQHTWFRRGPLNQSSRLDYILTNIQTNFIKCELCIPSLTIAC